MAQFKVGVEIASLLPPGQSLVQDAFPTLSAAVKRLAEAGHAKWVDYAMGAPLPDGKRVRNATGAYARSIQLRQINNFLAEVFTDLPYARAIEDGAPERDMKAMLGSSLKVRLSRQGKRYLIIPFRHYGPNSVIGTPVPPAIADWWRDVPHRESSFITGHGFRASGTGAVAFVTRQSGRLRLVRGEVVGVRSRSYQWGRRLRAGDIRAMGLPEQAVRRFAGMVRFDRPASRGQPGGRQSQMITFRTMVEGSQGWIAKARPGLGVARAVAGALQPIAEKAIPKAVEADLRRLLGAPPE